MCLTALYTMDSSTKTLDSASQAVFAVLTIVTINCRDAEGAGKVTSISNGWISLAK
jgi:hypothetical protein